MFFVVVGECYRPFPRLYCHVRMVESHILIRDSSRVPSNPAPFILLRRWKDDKLGDLTSGNAMSQQQFMSILPTICKGANHPAPRPPPHVHQLQHALYPLLFPHNHDSHLCLFWSRLLSENRAHMNSAECRRFRPLLPRTNQKVKSSLHLE